MARPCYLEHGVDDVHVDWADVADLATGEGVDVDVVVVVQIEVIDIDIDVLVEVRNVDRVEVEVKIVARDIGGVVLWDRSAECAGGGNHEEEEEDRELCHRTVKEKKYERNKSA